MKNHPISLTHVHLRNCIATVVANNSTSGIVNILDAGCGNGELVKYLFLNLTLKFPNIDFRIYGFDVLNHGVQTNGFAEKAILMLEKDAPAVDWRSQIKFISLNEAWPYEGNFFDFIISNQVLEHVQDKDSFFKKVFLHLKLNGHSFHLAPLNHCIHEGHIWIPFAHRIKSYDFMEAYIRFFSRLGVGKFQMHRDSFGCTLDNFVSRHADYMFFWTSYASQDETLSIARKAGFRCDFRFSKEFYFLKLLQLMRRTPFESYCFKQSALLNAFSIFFLRYVSSVTLTLHKRNEY